MRKIPVSFLTNVFLLLFASAAFGYDGDYYTYGTINIVGPAWQMITLIFSAVSYGGLIAIAVLTSGVVVIIANIYSWYTRGHGSFYAWLPRFLLGFLLFLLIFSGYGTLTVYDQTMNTFKQYPGVPNGIVFIANAMSLIEKNVVDVVTTAGNPLIPYADGGKGMGLNLFLAAYDQEVKEVPALSNLSKSLDQYNKDCLFFELSQPNPLITIDQINNTAGNLTDIWSQAGNPAIPTVYYSNNNPAGATTTCDAAWTNISTDLQSFAGSYASTVLPPICQSQGFDSTDPNQMARCGTILDEYIPTLLANPGLNTPDFIIQNKIAQDFDYTVKNLNPISATAAVSTYNMMNSMVGAGVTAAQWMPVARGVLTAIVVSLLPILCIIIPTGLGVRGIKMIIGFFIFLCCWGVCDAVLHTLMLTLSLNQFTLVQQHNIGYTAMMMIPDTTTKAIAMFGYMLSFCIPLALFITTLFVEFGGYALTSMMMGVAGMAQTQGAEASRKTITPEGQAASLESWRTSIPTIANANKFDYTNDVMQRTMTKMAQTGAGLLAFNALGSGVEGASYRLASIDAGKRSGEVFGVEQYARATNQSPMMAQSEISRINANRSAWEANSVGESVSNIANQYFDGDMNKGMMAYTAMAPAEQAAKYVRFSAVNSLLGNSFGGSYENYAGWEKQGSRLSEKEATYLTSQGYGQFYEGQHLIVGFANGKSIVSAHGENIDIGNGLKAKVTTDGKGTTMEWTKDGLAHERIIGADGIVSLEKAHGTVNKESPWRLNDRYSVVGGEIEYKGGQISGWRAEIWDDNLKRNYYGNFSQDAATGKVNYISGNFGEELQDKDIHSSIFERLNQIRTGTRVETGIKKDMLDIDTTTVARGTIFGGDVYGTALTSDGSLIVSRHILAARNVEERNQIINAYADSYAKSAVLGRTGQDQTYTKGSAEAGGGIKFGKDGDIVHVNVGVGGGVGGVTQDTRNIDLVRNEITRKINDSIGEANNLHLTDRAKEGFLADKIKDYASWQLNKFRGVNEYDYGASAIPKAVADQIKDKEPPMGP